MRGDVPSAPCSVS